MTENRHRPYLHRVERPLALSFFAFSFLVTAVMAATAVQAASDTLPVGRFTAACARQDLRASEAIEARSEDTNTTTEWLADAGLKQLQARILCLSGQEEKGVALYQSIIDVAPPVLSTSKTIERVRQ